MMDEIEVLRELTIGNIKLRTYTVYDTDQYLDDYGVSFASSSHAMRNVGRYSFWRDYYIFDRRSRLMYCPKYKGSDLQRWRTHNNEFISAADEPDLDRPYARESTIIAIRYDSEMSFRAVYKEMERWDSYLNDQWYYMGIVTDITLYIGDDTASESDDDWEEIGSSSIWSVESDSSKRHIREMVRNTMYEAVVEAKAHQIAHRLLQRGKVN